MAQTYCQNMGKSRKLTVPGKRPAYSNLKEKAVRNITSSKVYVEKEERTDVVLDWARRGKGMETVVIGSYNMPIEIVKLGDMKIHERTESASASASLLGVLRKYPREFMAAITSTVFCFTLFCVVVSAVLVRPILASDVAVVSLVLSASFFLMTQAAPRKK